MLPIERRYAIRNLLKKKNHMKISDLSQEFGVSEMTIHRDIKPLVEEGFLIKTFGGVTLADFDRQEDRTEKATSSSPSPSPSPVKSCVVCDKKTDDLHVFRIMMRGCETEIACCAHCGLLRYEQMKEHVVQMVSRDFLLKTTINAPHATYVMNSCLSINCCQPELLPFAYYEHAERFVQGFGGQLLSFQEAIDVLTSTEEVSCCDEPSHS